MFHKEFIQFNSTYTLSVAGGRPAAKSGADPDPSQD
jgi:hypothetical protein